MKKKAQMRDADAKICIENDLKFDIIDIQFINYI